jgi:hypothetical protein
MRRDFGHIAKVVDKDDKKFAFAYTIDDQQVYLNEKLLVYSDQDLVKNKVFTFVMTKGADGFFGKKAKLLEAENDIDTLNHILVKTIKLQFQHLYKEPLRVGFSHYIDLIIDNYEELSELKSQLIKNIESIVDSVRFKDDLGDLVRYFEFYNLYFTNNIDEFVNELDRLVSNEYLKELWDLGLPINLGIQESCTLFLIRSSSQRVAEHLNTIDKAEILSAQKAILDGFTEKVKEFNSYVGWPIHSQEKFKELLQDIVYLTLSDDLKWLDSRLLQVILVDLTSFESQARLKLRGARIELNLHHLASYIFESKADYFINAEELVKVFVLQAELDRILFEEGQKKMLAAFKSNESVVVKEYYSVFEKYTPESQLIIINKWIVDNAPKVHHIELWLSNIMQEMPFDSLSEVLIVDEVNSMLRGKIEISSAEDKTKLSNKVYLDLDEKYTSESMSLGDCRRYLVTLSELLPPFKEFAVKLVSEYASAYVRLELWSDQLYKSFDFNDYKSYVFMLDGDKQRYFMKWSLKLVAEGDLQIGTEEFLSIPSMNLSDAFSYQQLDANPSLKLEFSTNLLLRLLSKLNSQSFEARGLKQAYKKTLFEIAAESISDPKQIPYLNGYFDKCAGRCLIAEKNEKGEVKLTRHLEFSPQRHEICDGSRAILPNGEMNLDKEHGELFFWCGGSPCFETNRKLKTKEDWKNYSILDFLTILKIPYDELQFEILLGVINKANEFWSHLKCRSCAHLLFPKGLANLSAWSINTFSCTNEHCDEIGEGVYINHCLNGLCESVIDGRDSSRCIPIGFEDASGPYVCNYCLSCCSDSFFAKRAYVSRINNREYRGPTLGHRNKSVSCNKCGHSMGSGSLLAEKHQKFLEKLLNGESDERIVKRGQNNASKHWFILRKLDSEILEDWEIVKLKIYKLGFNFGKDGDTKSDTQFVAEPYQSVLETLRNRYDCNHCGNSIDLTVDSERANAFRKFHETSENG